MCVLGCSWSDEFPIDTIGSGGSLKSVGIRDRVFEVRIQLECLTNFKPIFPFYTP